MAFKKQSKVLVSHEVLAAKNGLKKAQISKAKKLLGKNLKPIEDHFGSIEDAFYWFRGNDDFLNFATILNDISNGFKQK